jgi:hypothetical protein
MRSKIIINPNIELPNNPPNHPVDIGTFIKKMKIHPKIG